MAVTYEWTVEVLEDPSDQDSDILETQPFDHLEDALKFMRYEPEARLVLVRNVGNDLDGLTDRLWAYVEDGKLPEYFEDGGAETTVRVPGKCIRELAFCTA